MMKAGRIICGFIFCSLLASIQPPRAASADWHGWQRLDFRVANRDALLILPKAAARGKPWIWRTEFFGHQPQADLALLAAGFHVAYIDMQNLYGAPPAMRAMDAMYAHVTATYELADRVVLEGFSRGGLYTLNWAARNPSKVACIYNDAPVCDFKSWPAGKGRSPGSTADWQRCLQAYGFDNEAAALAYAENPIDQLQPLATAKIPLLHICGADDKVVPLEENSLLVKQRYEELGGPITMIVKPHCGHHPHSLTEPTRILNFIFTHTGLPQHVTPAETPFGYDYFQLRDSLAHSREQFETRKTGRVVFLGGSITASSGWRDLVCQHLQERFPDTEFDFINAGIPSLGSTPGAFRFQRDVMPHGPVDLLFVEAAVNDDTNGFSDAEQVRGMEGIVRQALLENPQIDIIMLHFADPGKVAMIRRGESPAVIVNHERVAAHYGVSSIDLAREVTERIDAGEFTWEEDFRDLHPAPFGHQLYANSITRLFVAAWDSQPAVSEKLGVSEKPADKPLPQPLDPASYFHGRLISPTEIATAEGTTLGTGWRFEAAWQPDNDAGTKRVGTRPGFVNVPALVTEEPGATMRFSFGGRGIGVFVASGPDTGRLEYRLDDGDWQTCELFTQWSPALHLPWAKMLAADLSPGKHSLELRAAATSDPQSAGQAIRIIHLLVNDASAAE
ncbi:SGNH/GDSL hydrolase family protein [Planctomycetaceae bacterium SH139]